METNVNSEERIVMTPVIKEIGRTVLRMERQQLTNGSNGNNSSNVHEAGGAHKGIVINKQSNGIDNGQSETPSALSLSFKVYLVNTQTNVSTAEKRQLRFWFRNSLLDNEQSNAAQNFFRDLVNPSDLSGFPRDYVGYIMKIMKLMQHKYREVTKLEASMVQDKEPLSSLPDRPMSMIDDMPAPKAELTEQKVLEMIESSYPNAISLFDIASSTCTEEETVHFFICELVSKNLIKAMDNGQYLRVATNDTEVKLVKQMPKVVRSQQPTIAIITAQYCEKVAVDIFIEQKNTFMRFKTEGESNVYTLGQIGAHRVVCTKLPAVGNSRDAMIAAGNTTTRLLGTFQRIEYVFLVGVGGGVPHYTDYNQHVRLGDVVVSCPGGKENPIGKEFVYLHCDRFENSPEHRASSPSNGEVSVENFNYRTWCPPNLDLQELSRELYALGLANEKQRTWERFLNEALKELDANEQTDFARPDEEGDKLYMSIGTKDVIEVGHPERPQGVSGYDPRSNGYPVMHFGPVASGRVLTESIRQDVAAKFGIKAFDSEFDSVTESVFGNRKDRYIFLRGISDYKDGTRKKEWQPFAALAAAAFMKTIICTLPPAED